MATILVVDDNAINRAFLVTLLGYGKHRMLEAADGIEGLKVMQLEPLDLVISDILMPHMDGHEFVTRIHANPATASTPVIFYTAGYHEAEARVIARACGVSQVLAKPAEPEVILRTVNSALGLPEQTFTLPTLTPPPAEGSRFSTIDGQLAEYLVELESSSVLLEQLVAQPEAALLPSPESTVAAKRLVTSLSNLQSAGTRLSALMQISRDVAAEPEHQTQADVYSNSDQQSDQPAYGINEAPVPYLISRPTPDANASPNLNQINNQMNPPALNVPPISNGTVTARVSRERAKFQARLAKALQFAGYSHDSPTQLAREFNFRFSGQPVTIHAARKWLVGESIPTQDKLRILAQWLGVTAEWLRFGDTEYPEISEPARQAPAANSDEAKLLAKLLELDPYHRRLAHDFVSMLALNNSSDQAPDSKPGTAKSKNASVRFDPPRDADVPRQPGH
jgi:CheY-like chemotaxis protein